MTIAKDSRLNPTHISLYMALFNIWNINRFPEDFIIIRDEIMKLSKIGSKSTYHRCLKQLDSWKYIRYIPSHNSFIGSRVSLFIFGTTSKQPLNSPVPNQGQPLVPYINNNKQNQNLFKRELPQNEEIVISFFSENDWPKIEAQKFYAHYSAIGWRIGGKIKMMDWYASAKSWMLKAKDLNLKQTPLPQSQNRDNLKTTKSKNYKEPL
ncbi:hypothetical protein K8089_06830 [Aequorivita sp. F47161]|uniref:Uncharacterized protein n=1 Tax=Aequorivita vitellina TaxID=2874475 RepID=A0A9X1QWM7_9FLAO|nr:hypothetical protein [Aequorivita vitellina]MCG2418732.1 hypothetical protein [Aequorivita vitellina]